MPYDGNGAYSAPVNSWNPAVSQTVIDPSDWNSTQSDYETALSNVICKDGQTNPTANLPMAGFKHTGVNTNSGNLSRSEYVSGATLQDGAPLDAGDTGGTSTAYTATLTPAITAYADKQCFRVKFNSTCGANPTINFDSVGAKKIYKNVAGTATQLSASDIYVNKVAILRYDTALDAAAGGFWLLNEPGLPQSFSSITFDEGAAPSTPSANDVVLYAKSDGRMYSKDDAGTEVALSGVSLPQVIGGSASITSASATATFTATAVLAKTSLTGIGYLKSSFSQAVNLGTTGAGGMDTGTAPVSGYVCVYAIYNPATDTWSAIACNQTTSSAEIYGGANMPSGYTASALIATIPTNGSGQFIVCELRNRSVYFAAVQVVTSAAVGTTWTSVSIASQVPPNAKIAYGSASGTAGSNTWVAGTSGGIGTATTAPDSQYPTEFGAGGVPLFTPQTIWYRSSGANNQNVWISGYGF